MGNKLKDKWSEEVYKKLVGLKIIDVRYMTDKETKAYDWPCAAIVIVLEDGNTLIPSTDDEGNGPGALFTTFEDLPIIPVI